MPIKLTESRLRQIIREEVKSLIRESEDNLPNLGAENGWEDTQGSGAGVASAKDITAAWTALGGPKGYTVNVYDLTDKLGLKDPSMINFHGTRLMRYGDDVIDM